MYRFSYFVALSPDAALKLHYQITSWKQITSLNYTQVKVRAKFIADQNTNRVYPLKSLILKTMNKRIAQVKAKDIFQNERQDEQNKVFDIQQHKLGSTHFLLLPTIFCNCLQFLELFPGIFFQNCLQIRRYAYFINLSHHYDGISVFVDYAKV